MSAVYLAIVDGQLQTFYFIVLDFVNFSYGYQVASSLPDIYLVRHIQHLRVKGCNLAAKPSTEVQEVIQKFRNIEN